MKYSVITFGCRVNQADSLAIQAQLRAAGAAAVPPEQADLVVVNTCSVTASSDQGARQTIRRIARANPDVSVVVTGCYATRCAEEVARLPNVIGVVANDDKPDVLKVIRGMPFLTAVSESATTAERFGDGEGSCGATIEPGMAGRTVFTLRVQTGCAQPCAYCIIPTTRGRPRSLPVAAVLHEVERLGDAGFKEIVLTGVHLGSYGRDLDPPSSLTDLLSALADRWEGREGRDQLLFRVSSLEPMDCSSQIVDLLATRECLASHLHLPLQHASDRVLAAMRRPYTLERYAALVEDIKARVAGASIGSDIIVGFPGESDADFACLMTYLERSPLTHLHVFPYSDRPGTVAAELAGKIAGTVIRDRARQVRDVSARLTESFRTSQVGTVHRALTLEDGSLAVTGNYLKVRIPPGHTRNEWVHLRVTNAIGPVASGAVLPRSGDAGVPA